jgi:hypothetical protein
MFCAIGGDRQALARLGEGLARLFHDRDGLRKVIEAIGPDGFDD